ncbi:MAG: hypothetical protein JWM36_2485 [Hyphomicrobiales bacterium]|nr:hypothetical protein [Hyphomicrobiales bacterium]
MREVYAVLFCIIPLSYGIAGTKSENYQYSVIARAAKDVVDDLSTLISKEIILTHPLNLNIKNWSVFGTEGEIVSHFSASQNIFYNYDGVKYELTPPSAATLKVFSPASITKPDLIKKLHVIFPRFSELSVSAKDDLVIVRGSDNFVNIAGKIIETKPRNELEVVSYGRYLDLNKKK